VPRIEDLSPLQKVAVFLIALGQETAKEVLRQMDDEETRFIAGAIVEMHSVTPELQEEVLEEFEMILSGGVPVDGQEFITGILGDVLGQQQAEKMLDELGERRPNGFYILRDVDSKQLGNYLSTEHPQTVALILSQVTPEQAAGVFRELPEASRADVAYRMSRLGDISPDTLADLEAQLAEDMEAILSGRMTTIGGIEAVAQMLNEAGNSEEVLDEIEQWDAPVAEDIRGEMLTFHDLTSLTDEDIRELLQNVDKENLMMALKGASNDEGVAKVKEKIFKNISQSRRKMLAEDIEYLGPVLKNDVEEARRQIVAAALALEKTGGLRIVRGDGAQDFVM
jgi:flagellar motor switch protein FliG